MAASATGTTRIAFTAHSAGVMALRPVDPPPDGLVVPPEVWPGESFLGLFFADLAAAFAGELVIGPGDRKARIVTSLADGMPPRLHFALDPRGLVTLRSLDGEWGEEVAPGRAVFGILPSRFRRVGEGMIELDPASLQGVLQTSEAADPGDDQEDQEDAVPLGRRAWLAIAAGPLVGAVLVVLAAVWPAGDTDPGTPRAPSGDDLPAASPGEPPLDLAREYAAAGRAAITRGVELAEVYLDNADTLDRIDRALALCEGEQACTERFEPARIRAERALDAAGEAYLAMVQDAALKFPSELLGLQLAELARAPVSGAEEQRRRELARRFLAHAAEIERGNGLEAVRGDLLAQGPRP